MIREAMEKGKTLPNTPQEGGVLAASSSCWRASSDGLTPVETTRARKRGGPRLYRYQPVCQQATLP